MVLKILWWKKIRYDDKMHGILLIIWYKLRHGGVWWSLYVNVLNIWWDIIMILQMIFKCSGLPGETISFLVCVQPTYGTQEYQTCTQSVLSGNQFPHGSSWASDIHFLCPEKFTLGQVRIQTMILSICS